MPYVRWCEDQGSRKTIRNEYGNEMTITKKLTEKLDEGSVLTGFDVASSETSSQDDEREGLYAQPEILQQSSPKPRPLPDDQNPLHHRQTLPRSSKIPSKNFLSVSWS